MWARPGGQGRRGPQTGAAEEDAVELFQLAKRWVLRLEVEREAEPGEKAVPGRVPGTIGGAVVVAIDPPDALQSLTLATAYHVLAGAKSFTVQDHSKMVVAISGRDTECFIDRSRELAFVRVKLEPGKGKGLRAIDLEKAAELQKDAPALGRRQGAARRAWCSAIRTCRSGSTR